MDKVNPGPESVETLIIDRLSESGLPRSVQDLVFAALLGASEMEAALSDGNSTGPARQRTAVWQVSRYGTYLKSIKGEEVVQLPAPTCWTWMAP